MFKSILLAVDGSGFTESVVKHGIYLAKSLKSRLKVITVADIRVFEWVSAVGADGFVPIVPSGIYEDESHKILDEKADKVLNRCADLINAETIEFETEKVSGDPAESILKFSQLADLVIVGKQGEFAKWGKKSLGATVEAVSKAIHKPLLVVNKEFAEIKNILIAYDGSEHANHGLQYAGHLAESLLSKIKILCVTDDKEFGDSVCTDAEHYLGHFKTTFESIVQTGDTKSEIVNVTTANTCDMIVMGAYGHSRLREVLLGSTTEHILRMAPCPVLLAK